MAGKSEEFRFILHSDLSVEKKTRLANGRPEVPTLIFHSIEEATDLLMIMPLQQSAH